MFNKARQSARVKFTLHQTFSRHLLNRGLHFTSKALTSLETWIYKPLKLFVQMKKTLYGREGK